MAKKETASNTAMQVMGNGDMIAGVFDDPNKAFEGLDAEMFPVVWNFKRAGEYIDGTVIGLSVPILVNDDFDGDREVDTWEIAISPDFRVRVMNSAQLWKMLPSLVSKRIRLVYCEMLDVGQRRVKVFRAATFKDQSGAVALTEAERARERELQERVQRESQERAERAQRARDAEAARRAASAASKR
jgi:hypothetical protein